MTTPDKPIAAQQVNEQHGDSGLTGSVPADAATTCPRCFSQYRDERAPYVEGKELFLCPDPWHDTPPDSAPVAGSAGATPSQEGVVSVAATTCPTCGSDDKNLLGTKCQMLFGYRQDDWHDTPTDSAPAVGNTERSSPTYGDTFDRDSQYPVNDVVPAAGGGDTNEFPANYVVRVHIPCTRCHHVTAHPKPFVTVESAEELIRQRDEARHELADAKAKIAELEREVTAQTWAAESAAAQIVTDDEMDERLACARAETANEAIDCMHTFLPESHLLDRAEEAIRAIASAPPGYVCMPVEPTRDIELTFTDTFILRGFKSAYRDMLSAAMKQP